MNEWFLPGSAPGAECDWHEGDAVRLPAVFAEWAAATRSGAVAQPVVRRTSPGDERDDGRFRIVSPREGDRYRASPGVPARYSTVALRAAGGAKAKVSWFVDGARVEGSRWSLETGRHIVRAETAGMRDEVVIEVD